MNYYYVWKTIVKKLLIYSLVIIDLINQRTFDSSCIYNFCFKELKLLIFKISGHCVNSGFCCQKIQIKYEGAWISSLTLYDKIIKKNSIMKRFVPDVIEDKKIYNFSCTSFNSSNLCDNYDTRPNFCKSYPFSVLFSNDKIKAGCGYYLEESIILPKFSSKKLKRDFMLLKYNHNIL